MIERQKLVEKNQHIKYPSATYINFIGSCKCQRFFFAKPIINDEIEKLKKRVQKLNSRPCLKVILVGNNPSSIIYVNNKLSFVKKIDADCEIMKRLMKKSLKTHLLN